MDNYRLSHCGNPLRDFREYTGVLKEIDCFFHECADYGSIASDIVGDINVDLPYHEYLSPSGLSEFNKRVVVSGSLLIIASIARDVFVGACTITSFDSTAVAQWIKEESFDDPDLKRLSLFVVKQLTKLANRLSHSSITEYSKSLEASVENEEWTWSYERFVKTYFENLV